MPRKLLLVAPCLSMGGMERASANLANALCVNDVEVVFVSLFKKEHFFCLDDNIVLEEPMGFNNENLSLIKSIKWIQELVKKHQPDSVLAFNKFYGAITALALINNKAPFYISERSSPLYEWATHIKFINRLAFKLRPPMGIIAQTKIAAYYQKRYFKKSNVIVIPNMVREIQAYPHIKKENVILAVGRLGDNLKGFDLLLDSFALVKNQNWQLNIAGGNENGEDLKQQAAHLGIRNRVKFLGKVKNIDLEYAKAGLFVIPSRSEGFPNALAEAMAAGCTCIAFDFIAGPRDIIETEKNGVIVEKENVQALALEIDRLIQNPLLRKKMGIEAKDIGEKLSSQNIVEKFKKNLKLSYDV